MLTATPATALGAHHDDARDTIVRVVRDRHERSAEAAQITRSRNGMGFASQWKDLLDDNRDAFVALGYRTQKLLPAGYHVPIVNDCLLYVWRIPTTPNAIEHFALTPTRLGVFHADPPPPTLFDQTFGQGGDEDVERVRQVVRDAPRTMPVILVLVDSSPRQLSSIDWAVASLDAFGQVLLSGRERIWAPELGEAVEPTSVEAFDSGIPAEPVVELQSQEGPLDDA